MIEDDATVLALDVLAGMCRFLRRWRRDLTPEDVIRKPDGSPVTVCDLAAQALIVNALKRDERLGKVLICGEESAGVLREPGMELKQSRVVDLVQSVEPALDGEEILALIDWGHARPKPGVHTTYWTCDPIDGTKRFISGHQYSSCIGFVYEGRLVAGAILCPDLSADPNVPLSEPDPHGSLFGVVRGQGIFVVKPADPRGERRMLQLADDLQDPEVVRVARAVGSKRVGADLEERIRQACFRVEMVEIDNQCKYAALGTGRVDLITQSGAQGESRNVWDFAPGVLLASEAGGLVFDSLGRELDFDQGATLSANKGLFVASHEEVVTRLCSW